MIVPTPARPSQRWSVALGAVLLVSAAGCASASPQVREDTAWATRESEAAPAPARNCVVRPSRCGYPDETNTGVTAGVVLRPSGSVTADRDGQVIEGLDITGEINVRASDVVIRQTRITGGKEVGNADWVVVIRPGAENLVIEDSEIRTPAGSEQDIACILNIGDARPTITRVDIHGCSAGVSSGGGLVQESYIHDLAFTPGLSHVVGVASNGGGGLTVRHNTILNTYPQTAAVALYQDFERQADNVIEDNLVAGGSYCFYGGEGDLGAAQDIRIVRNRLSGVFFPQCGRHGPLAAFDHAGPGNVFQGNIWDESGKEVAP